jgi:hypothetical protein
MPSHPFSQTLIFTRELLEHCRVEYMVVGSVANSAYGDPRATNDVDVVIEAMSQQLRCMAEVLNTKDFYFDANEAQSALRQRSMFNIIDMGNGCKVDFIFKKRGAFDELAFERRRKASVFGIDMVISTPEDVVIAKLSWAKLGESQRQINDVGSVLAVKRVPLDLEYVERWVKELGLDSQWAAAQKAAAESTGTNSS